MAEELGVDGAFGDGATVDGEILLTTARRIIMDYAWNDFLTHTALSDDEHTEVGGRHLECDVEHVVQCIAVAYDIVPLFDGLKFRCLHLS